MSELADAAVVLYTSGNQNGLLSLTDMFLCWC
jgi:hypothetical protein